MGVGRAVNVDRPNAGVVDDGSMVAFNHTGAKTPPMHSADTPGSDARIRAGGKDSSDDDGNAATPTPIGTPKQPPVPWPCFFFLIHPYL